MSRAFVKEDDTEAGAELVPERVPSDLPNYVTPRGHALLVRQVEDLRAKREAALALADEAERKSELAHVDRDLRYFLHQSESAIVVDGHNLPQNEVHFGSRVTVAGEDGAETTYVIVGEDEADLANGLLNFASPLARALVKAKVGDSVTWKRPAGDVELEILGVVNGAEGVPEAKPATKKRAAKKIS